MTAKYKVFFNNLISFLNRYDNVTIKETIGDSTNNHRVATVNQVIRFLESRRNPSLKTLAEDLALAYDLLREELVSFRTETSRTDAIDINEFVEVYNTQVLETSDTSLRRSLSKQLTAI